MPLPNKGNRNIRFVDKVELYLRYAGFEVIME